MKKLIPFLLLFGCNTNQNYDKSMLPNADPAILSKVNSRGLITCMQIPTPLPPIPINKDHKVPQTEVEHLMIALIKKWLEKIPMISIMKEEKRKSLILRLI